MMIMVGGSCETKDDEGNVKYRAVVQFHMDCKCEGNDMDSKICDMRSFLSAPLFDTSDEAGMAANIGAPAIAEKLGIVFPEGDSIFVDGVMN
jgi:hypothetical protein